MNTVRRTLVRLALVLAVAPVAGCTFGMFPRESHDPALGAMPPCFSGDVGCAGPFDSGGFGWTRGVLLSATGR